MARYNPNSALDTVMVAAGGGYEETFNLIVKPTAGMVMSAADATTDGERGIVMAARFIQSWSLQDADGRSIPITLDNIRGLPIEMIGPVLDHMVSAMSFLPSVALSAQAKASK